MKYLFTLLTIFLILAACSSKEKKTSQLKLATGKVERFENFTSEFISGRNIDVWLPDDYTDGEKYAVLYMHDGQMLYDSTTSWNQQEWGVDETMGQLLKDKKIRNTIVVGIWNTEFRHSEYFPQKPFESLNQPYRDSLMKHNPEQQETALFKSAISSDNYLKFMVKELKPFIDSTYSTLPEKEHTFVAGSSMGGLISMYALCEYPDVFQGAACLSTHWVGIFDTINNPIPSKFVAYLDKNLPNPETHKMYFDYGTETLDALYEPFQTKVDSIMVKHNYNQENWKTLKFEGEDHSERAWNKRLDIPLKFLLSEEK